jgi:hypothetical protein
MTGRRCYRWGRTTARSTSCGFKTTPASAAAVRFVPLLPGKAQEL